MKAGVYLHIPFCKSRCSYCDFATDVYRSDEAVERYVRALCREIENSGFQIPDSRLVASSAQSKIQSLKSKIDTVYFGGGTPSLLSAAQMERILGAIQRNFSLEPEIELTVEMNPATVSPEKLRDYRALGVNRASFGVQTFDDRALKLLARGHDARDARQTFAFLREAGFDNVSFDLIAGLPGQTLAGWEDNLTQALSLRPEHLSLYLLEVHEGTPLAAQIAGRRQPAPDEDLAAAMYETMLDRTAAAGYEQYEISNFSLAGRASRHNSKYWRLAPVFAFGVSAHSFDGARRWSNERDTNRYVNLVEEGRSPVAEINELDSAQLAAEFAFLNLRLTEGLDLDDYRERFGVDLRAAHAAEFDRLRDFGLIAFDRERLSLTRRGMVYSNEVFSVFV